MRGRDVRRALVGLVAVAGAAAATGCGHRSAYWVGVVGQIEGRESARENLRGIELATEQVNAAGGINGHPVRLVVRDDQGEGDVAARAARELESDRRISVIVGHTTSTAMLAAAPVYDGRIAAIATTATAPMLSGISSWVFRVISSDSVTGAQLARFAGKRGWRSAAILYQNDVYGRGLADAFRSNFAGKLVSSDPVPADADDLSAFVRFYQRYTPDVVFVVAGRSAIPVLLQRSLAKAHLPVAILASEGATDLLRDAPGAEQIFAEAPFSAESADSLTARFTTAFVKRFGHEPLHDAALAYDAAVAAFAALRAAGPNRAAIREYLANIDPSRAPVGATGKIYFDGRGDRIDTHAVLLHVKDGHLVPVSDAFR